MINIGYFVFNAFQTRCSVVWDQDKKCAVIDPGYADPAEREELMSFISDKGLEPVCVMLTHAHFDHIYGMADLVRTFRIPVYVHEDEIYTMEKANPYICSTYGLPLPDTFPIGDENHVRYIKEDDVIDVGSLHFKVIETAGHSKGGVCFLEEQEKVLFSGDTLFAGAIGRTDHPGGDYDVLIRGILDKLMALEGDIKVIPGHGPQSEIASERGTNPFLMPFNEPYED